jgi:hypothetical protein
MATVIPPLEPDRARLDAIIGRHLDDVRKEGVLSVRPGYKVTDDWLTHQEAIVVTVAEKLAHPPPGETIPPQLDGVPTDVREASPNKRLELDSPMVYAGELRLAPDTGSVPHFPDERTLEGTRPGAAASAHARLETVRKPELPYSGPTGVTLAPVEATATIVLSASPDAGWPTLDAFLSGTRSELTVGLYDFTSAHIKDAMQRALDDKQLTLVLDHPPTNHTADQTDEETVAALRGALGSDFDQAWALSKLDPEASAWIFATAYHIKVAVRDHTTVWLSSGNWNNSNQPDIEPSQNAADAETARTSARDWHVVIRQRRLASVFERYLRNDYEVASAHNLPPTLPVPRPPRPMGGDRTPVFAQFFAPATIKGKIKIAPLLTPDPGVYADAVKQLIESAQQTLYMQYQYIKPPQAPDASSAAFVDLIEAVIARQQDGVDVRIIMSQYETAGYLEQLQAMGLDVVAGVKIQSNVHNKGIVVDGATVLVSSQNWSTDGVLRNRDAGVILYSAEAAAYFQEIFLHDWDHLARRRARPD